MKNKHKIIFALIAFCAISFSAAAQTNYLRLNKSVEAVVRDRFNGDAESYVLLSKGEFINKLSRQMGVSVPDLLNLAARDRAINPKGIQNTQLWKLFDPCENFSMSLKDAEILVKARNAKVIEQDVLDRLSANDIQVFAKAEDCDSVQVANGDCPKVKKTDKDCCNNYTTNNFFIIECCDQPAQAVYDYRRDTIFINDCPDCRCCQYYAHLGVTYTFNHGIGASAEIGMFTKHFRLGIIGGVMQRDVDGLAFWSNFAAAKIGWDFYTTEKFRIGIGALGGFWMAKQEMHTANFSWSATKHSPFFGGFLEASYLFTKHFGIFGGVQVDNLRLKTEGQEILKTIIDNHGVITQDMYQQAVGKTTNVVPVTVSLGLRFTF